MCSCSISCHVGQPSCSHLTTPIGRYISSYLRLSIPPSPPGSCSPFPVSVFPHCSLHISPFYPFPLFVPSPLILRSLIPPMSPYIHPPFPKTIPQPFYPLPLPPPHLLPPSRFLYSRRLITKNQEVSAINLG